MNRYKYLAAVIVFMSCASTAFASDKILCTETDGGDNLIEKGTVTYWTDTIYNENNEAEEVYETIADQCKTGTALMEYNCDNYKQDKRMVEPHIVDCETVEGKMFCHDGECVSVGDLVKPDKGGTGVPVTTGCVDSDNGDIYKAGYTTFLQDGEPEGLPIKDYCIDGTDNMLMEVTCEGTSVIYNPVTCTKKCVEGACVEEKKCIDPDADLGDLKVEIPLYDDYVFHIEHGVKSTTVVKGMVNGDEYEKDLDYCVEGSNNLVEFGCDGKKLSSDIKNCDDYDVDIHIPWPVNFDYEVNFICSNGRCCPDTPFCSDSDGGITADKAGSAMIMSCDLEKMSSPLIDMCGIAVCTNDETSLEVVFNDMECPPDKPNGGIKQSDGKYGDYAKEAYCKKGDSGDSSPEYIWVACKPGTICQEGVCAPVTVAPFRVIVDPSGKTEFKALQNYCEDEKTSMKVVVGLNSEFAQGAVAVRPEVYRYHKEIACPTWCQDENGACEPTKKLPSLMQKKEGFKDFRENLRKKIKWFKKIILPKP